MRASVLLIITTVSMVFGLVSCGASEAEVELQRMRQEESRQAFQKLITDSLANVERTISRFEEELDRMKGELAVAEDRLMRASEFKLLRAPAEREAQIQQATTTVQRIKRWIEENEPNMKSWKDLRSQLRAQQNR